MSYDIERLRRLPAGEFRRLLGVPWASRPRPSRPCWPCVLKARAGAKTKPGRPPDLGLEEQLTLALRFWREYRAYLHLAFEWEVGEDTVCAARSSGSRARWSGAARSRCRAAARRAGRTRPGRSWCWA